MTKALPATCEDGVVSYGEYEVPNVEILSGGVGASQGTLVLDGDKRFYIANTTPDLSSTLEKIASALGEIASALSTIDAKPVGGTGSAPAPGAASEISAITSLQGELEDLKDSLQ